MWARSSTKRLNLFPRSLSPQHRARKFSRKVTVDPSWRKLRRRGLVLAIVWDDVALGPFLSESGRMRPGIIAVFARLRKRSKNTVDGCEILHQLIGGLCCYCLSHISRLSTIRLVVQDFLHPPNMSLFLLNCWCWSTNSKNVQVMGRSICAWEIAY